jgi:di/tricarboxylate transporter
LLLPSALEAAHATGIRPSKLLIPVSFGSMLGGGATYFTTANIIISGLLRIAEPPQPALGVLDFTPTGGLIAVAGIAFLALFGQRLLPDHEPSLSASPLRPTGSDLEDAYGVGERLWSGVVAPGSTLVRKTLEETAIGEALGVTIAAIQRGRDVIFPLRPSDVLLPRDVLLIVGRQENVELLAEQGITVKQQESGVHISTLGLHLIEVAPAPRSAAEGQTLRELAFRRIFGLTAIALWRRGRSHRTGVADIPLEMGDSLLMIGSPEVFSRVRASKEFIVLEPSLSDQPVQPGPAWTSVAVILAGVAASIAGVPVALAMLAAAVAAVLLGLLSMEEAYRSIEWQAIFLIAGMVAVSLAMVETGLAQAAGGLMVKLAAPFGPLGLAAGAFLLSSLLTQAMGGQVTALITGPIAISAAITLGIHPQPVALATALGCSVSFLTPLAHPVNILMIAPANYTFADFFRIGLPLTVLSFLMLLAGLVIFWGL